MTAPTSPKPHTPADPTVSKDAGTTLDKRAADAGLRTALTKLADKWNNQAGALDPEGEVRALLAAHPAPETDEDCGNCLGISVETCMTHPAPVSDTRREDVAAEAAWRASQEVNGFAEDQWKHVPEPQRASWQHIARAVLAVLPAPPMVMEDEIETRLDEAERGLPLEARLPRPLNTELARITTRLLRGAAR